MVARHDGDGEWSLVLYIKFKSRAGEETVWDLNFAITPVSRQTVYYEYAEIQMAS